jgi:hypothetical protein
MKYSSNDQEEMKILMIASENEEKKQEDEKDNETDDAFNKSKQAFKNVSEIMIEIIEKPPSIQQAQEDNDIMIST